MKKKKVDKKYYRSKVLEIRNRIVNDVKYYEAYDLLNETMADMAKRADTMYSFNLLMARDYIRTYKYFKAVEYLDYTLADMEKKEK